MHRKCLASLMILIVMNREDEIISSHFCLQIDAVVYSDILKFWITSATLITTVLQKTAPSNISHTTK